MCILGYFVNNLKLTKSNPIIELSPIFFFFCFLQVSGHKRPDHSPMLSADMGDVLSLITHAKSQATALGRDLFVVDNGDIVDGTGVSDATDAHGQALFPLLMQIPYDALNIGNGLFAVCLL